MTWTWRSGSLRRLATLTVLCGGLVGGLTFPAAAAVPGSLPPRAGSLLSSTASPSPSPSLSPSPSPSDSASASSPTSCTAYRVSAGSYSDPQCQAASSLVEAVSYLVPALGLLVLLSAASLVLLFALLARR